MNITSIARGAPNRATPQGLFAAAVPAAIPMLLLLITACTTPTPEGPSTVAEVQARYQTEPLTTDGAIADPAVWVNRDDPGASLVLGSDNASGLYVFATDGRTLDFESLGRLNSIDVIGVDRSGGTRRLLVGATNPARGLVTVVAIDPASGEIESAPVAVERIDFQPHAFCATRLVGGTAEAFVASPTGELVHFNIAVPRAGDVTIRESARLELGGGVEACVADHTRRAVWVARNGVGVWQLPLRLAADSRPALAAGIDGRRLTSDVGGLAISRVAGETLLFASSPGDGSIAAFSLGSGRIQGGISRIAGGDRFHGRFRIVAGSGIDEVGGSYGIAAEAASGIAGLPGGVLVVQDRREPDGPQNFKLIALDDLAEALL